MPRAPQSGEQISYSDQRIARSRRYRCAFCFALVQIQTLLHQTKYGTAREIAERHITVGMLKLFSRLTDTNVEICWWNCAIGMYAADFPVLVVLEIHRSSVCNDSLFA